MIININVPVQHSIIKVSYRVREWPVYIHVNITHTNTTTHIYTYTHKHTHNSKQHIFVVHNLKKNIYIYECDTFINYVFRWRKKKKSYFILIFVFFLKVTPKKQTVNLGIFLFCQRAEQESSQRVKSVVACFKK